jgi:hypothetical protein
LRRHISIYLGERTSATHCGDCQILSGTGRCRMNGEQPAADEQGYLRTAACRSAEPPASVAANSPCTCGLKVLNRVEYRVFDKCCPEHGTKTRLRVVP